MTCGETYHIWGSDPARIAPILDPRPSLTDRAAPFVPAVPGLLLLAAAALAPLASADLWWHLSTGRWILLHGSLPATDFLSHTAGERAWILEEWLFQVVAAATNTLGGPGLLRLAHGALVAAALACAARAVPARWRATVILGFGVLLAGRLGLRPHWVSIPAFLAFRQLWLVDREPLTAVRLGRAAAFTTVWANVHAVALLAPLAAACMAAAPSPHRGRFARLAVVVGLASLITPSGLDLWRYAFEHSEIPRRYIDEWMTLWNPAMPVPGAILGMAAIAAACGILGHVALLRRGGTDLAGTALLVLACMLAASSRRFAWILVVPLFDAMRAMPAPTRVLRWALCLGLAGLLATTPRIQRGLDRLGDGTWVSPSVDAAWLPVEAADFLEASNLSGHLFHAYEHGGYLGWRLVDPRAEEPRFRVYLDGRTVLHGPVLEERWGAEHNPGTAVAEALFARRAISVAVMPNSRTTDAGGRAIVWKPPGSGWERVHTDATAVVWSRRP